MAGWYTRNIVKNFLRFALSYTKNIRHDNVIRGNFIAYRENMTLDRQNSVYYLLLIKEVRKHAVK